jgi:hypothetical protein
MDTNYHQPDNDNPDVFHAEKPGEDLGLIQSTVTPDTLMTFNQWSKYIFDLINEKK